MTRLFWCLTWGASLLTLCSADVSFQLAHSWAFPEAASSSLILQDAPSSDVEGATMASLRARTVRTTIHASSGSRYSAMPLEHMEDYDSQAPIFSNAAVGPIEVDSPDVADRETLLNLARASWDAYHSIPKPDHWYDIDGMNWVRSDRVSWWLLKIF